MISTCTLQRRSFSKEKASFFQAKNPTISALEAQLWVSRGAFDMSIPLGSWLQTPLCDLQKGAQRLLHAIDHKQPIVVVADYDCDGATACAVMVAGLRALGASVGYVVPDRMVHGYGISPSVVDLARERYPTAQILVTVDNGILGHAGIRHAHNIGLDVIVTDHHLPGDTIPDALAVINPSRIDDANGLSKLAGVGVALWLVTAVKKLLITRGVNTPSLNFLLPYVAIGTVADMVSLDAANRRLVSTGLGLIRQGLAPVGVQALFQEAGAAQRYITTQDIGFGVGPRINAVGRLDSMEAGIDLLLEQDMPKAKKMAQLLSETNEARKRLQACATDAASFSVDGHVKDNCRSIVRGSSEWHPGIVGLVASRLKDTHNLPTFVFALANDMAKGSGRSIPGFHLKDALEEIARRDDHILEKFGGHAMAAGATLRSAGALLAFEQQLDAVAHERVTAAMLQKTLLSDGPVPALSVDAAIRMLQHPWGQGFEAPAFDDEARIKEVSPLGSSGTHWKIQATVGQHTEPMTVVLFNQPEPAAGQAVHLYLQPGLNTWRNSTRLQWLGKVVD